MALREDWTRRAQARQTPRQPGRAPSPAGRFTRRTFPTRQPVRGIPIINEEALMTVPWVWSVVTATAGVAAGFPLRSHMKTAGRGDDMEPLPELMRWDPIGQTGYTAFHLLRDTYAALQVHGMAYWLPVDWDEFDRPSAVVPLWSQYAYPVRYVGDGRLRIQVSNGGRFAVYTPDQLIWFQSTGMLGSDDAYAAVRFLARMAGESILQAEHSHQALVSGGTTQGGIYYRTDRDIGEPLAQSWADFIDECGGGRSGRTMVLGDGLEARPLGMSWAELSLLEARRYSAVEVCAALGMPPGLKGISIDGASTTYSNLNQDLSLWDRITLSALTRTVTETMSVWWDPMTVHSADLSKLNALDRAKQHEIELRARYRTVDEVRDDEGWDPNPDLDKPAAAPAMNGQIGEQRVMMEEVVDELARGNGSAR